MSFANDDDELPSYESCLSEFTGELDSGTSPGHGRIHEVGAPEIGYSQPSLPAVPTDTKPSRNTSTVSEPIPGPPPIRRETRPDINTPTQHPDDPIYSTDQTPSNSKPYHYGSLLVDGLYPSDTLCRLADALFRQLTPSEFLEPFALARADDPNIQNAELAPQILFRFARFLILAGIPFTRTASNVPVLTLDSFIHWLVFEIRANPEHSYATWQTRLRHYSLYETHTRVYFAPIPRTAFPERAADTVLTNVHGVWRAIVDILRKRQDKVHVQRLQRDNDNSQPVEGHHHSRHVAMLTSDSTSQRGTSSSQRGDRNLLNASERKSACRFGRCVRKSMTRE